jgi:chromosome segregation ATPase
VLLASKEAAARFQAELDEMRAEAAAKSKEGESLRRELEEAKAAKSASDTEIAALRSEAAKLSWNIESLRSESSDAVRAAAERLAELESLRSEVQRLQREADNYKGEREQESRQLTQQLEQAVSEVSRSALEIQRLSEELESTRSRGGEGMLEEAYRLQHTLATTHDELWKHAPPVQIDGNPVTPEVINSDETDEQKMLVDALLRFLGRR